MKKVLVFCGMLAIMAVIAVKNDASAIWLWQVTGDLTGNNYHLRKSDSLPGNWADLDPGDLSMLRFDSESTWDGIDRADPRFKPAEWLDRQDPENYQYPPDSLRGRLSPQGKMLLPAFYRTTANNLGHAGYTYCGEGGFSWSIPYLTGLAALAWSVDGSLTFPGIVALLESTSTVNGSGVKVVQPVKFIGVVAARKQGNQVSIRD